MQRFFKTGPGEYGEGNRFLGVMVPQIRAIARAHRQTADASAKRSLLDSPWHEARDTVHHLAPFAIETNVLTFTVLDGEDEIDKAISKIQK